MIENIIRAKNRLAAKTYYENHKDDPEYKQMKKDSHNKWLEKNRDRWNAYQRERRKLRKQI